MLGDVEDDTLEWAGDEAERKANELQRQQNEQERITAEQARQAAEARRQNTFAAEVAQAQEAAETAEAEADRAKAEADRAAAIVGGDYLSCDELGQPDGVAGLGPDGKVPEEQLPEMDFLPLSGGAMTGAVNMDGNAVTNLPAPVNDGDAARKADVEAGKPKAALVSLPVAGWSGSAAPYTQNVTVSGISANESAQLILPMPAAASMAAYNAAGIQCTGQAANMLTFQCQTKPAAAISVYVTVQEVRALSIIRS